MAKKAEAASGEKEKKGAVALEAALAQIRKDFGDGAIMKLGEIEADNKVETISTGSFSLDMALGVWGLPRGRIVEIYGQESSGKTTLTLHVIAEAQRRGGVAAFIDVEHALDPSYARKIGVDVDNLFVAQPTSGEEALNIVETLARSSAVDIIVVDSVAALTPKAELDGEIGDSFVGTQARLMSQAMRKLTSVLAQTKTLCIFTNQIREKIGVMFGSPETTPGGKALKFYASVRLNISRIQQIKDTAGVTVGNRTRVKVVKNKVAPPFTEAEFDIIYNRGIWWEGSVLEAAIKQGFVQKRGSWLSYGADQIGQGSDKAAKFLEDNPEMMSKLVAELKNVGNVGKADAAAPSGGGDSGGGGEE
jgi:protein RecA